MPVNFCRGDNTGVSLDKGDGVVLRTRHDSVTGGDGTDGHRDKIVARLNELLETRVNLIDVAEDDPDKMMSAPEMLATYGERMFKVRDGDRTFLVSRSAIVTRAVWDGEKYTMSVRKPKGP